MCVLSGHFLLHIAAQENLWLGGRLLRARLAKNKQCDFIQCANFFFSWKLHGNIQKFVWIFMIWVSLFEFEFKHWFSWGAWCLICCNNIAGFRIAKWYSDNFISPPNYYLSPEKWNKLLDDLGIRAFISTSPCSFDMEAYTPTNPQRWNSGNSHLCVDYISKAKSIFF